MSSQETLSDINIVVAGRGGDGSLTVINLLSHLLGQRGFQLYSSRNVNSRIKGGQASAALRGSLQPCGCIGDFIDVVVAFEPEVLKTFYPKLHARSVIIFDGSHGHLDREKIPPGVRVLEMPFGRLAVRQLRRDLFKNSLSFGVLSRLLNVPDEEAVACLQHQFKRLPETAREANLLALQNGFSCAEQAGIAEASGHWHLDAQEHSERLLITGNEALAFGFLAAGGRYFAGYPITPATDVMDWLAPRLKKFGGVVVQAEDELAAINMCTGAALTGTRSMTATSGPGLALMMEGVGNLGSAEIPLVIVDCQRSGPSTGMPTKPEQSDINMMALGGTGDFPRIVLAPADPKDSFELSVQATNLAQRLQCPVFIAMDQAVGQDSTTTVPFAVDQVEVEPGNRLTADDLMGMESYRRYEVTEDGVSPWVVPGVRGGMNLVTGNERDEWGYVTAAPGNRKKMMDKRQRKIHNALDDLPKGQRWGDECAPIGVITVGMTTGVVKEAVERLRRDGMEIECLQPKTLWPVLDETVEFVKQHRLTLVVEHNLDGQLARLIAGAGAPREKIHSVTRYDGTPFRPMDLVQQIRQAEELL